MMIEITEPLMTYLKAVYNLVTQNSATIFQNPTLFVFLT
jgi:hypothetical protein